VLPGVAIKAQMYAGPLAVLRDAQPAGEQARGSRSALTLLQG